MGDRGQILIKDSGVYLYTHWCGYELQGVLKTALERGEERWDDPEYLTRIIFCQMLINEGQEIEAGNPSEPMDNLGYPEGLTRLTKRW